MADIFEICKAKVNKIANIEQEDKNAATDVITYLEDIYKKWLPYVTAAQTAPRLAEEFTKALVAHKGNPKINALVKKINNSTTPVDVFANPDVKTLLTSKKLNEIISNRKNTRIDNIQNKDKKHSRNNK